MPRRRDVASVLEPGRRLQIVDFIVDLFDGHEVGHPCDHAPDLRAVGQLDGVVDALQSERAEVPRCLGLVPMVDLTWVTRSVRHHHATSVTSGFFMLRSRYGAQHPGGRDLFGRLAAEPGDLFRTA